MDTNIFKSKFEAAVASAKKAKANGTTVTCKIYMDNGHVHQFAQYNGSWWKYEIDDDAATLQMGNRTNNDAPSEPTDLQYKSVRIIDIRKIAGFDVDYMTTPENPTSAT